MASPRWIKVVLVAYSLLTSVGITSASPRRELSASPSFSGADVCPQRCNVAGPNPDNWTAYHSLSQFDNCPLTVLQAFSIYADVDNTSRNHGIYACSSYGPDFSHMQKSGTQGGSELGTIDTTYEIGWDDDGHRMHQGDVRSAAKQLRKYLELGYSGSNATEIMYARSGRATAGVYIGRGLHNEGVSTAALNLLEGNLKALNATSRNVAVQLCQPDYTSAHIFGFFASSSRTFDPVQQAMRFWANGTCLSFPNSSNFSGHAVFTSPLVTASGSNITVSDATVGNTTTGDTSDINTTVDGVNSTSLAAVKRWPSRAKLTRRAECSTVQVEGGDGCGTLATKCGISNADFTEYNNGSDFCSTLQPGQHVCCSSGDLPDFRPKPNADGSCNVYYVPRDDNCAKIAAANSLTLDDLENFNKNTWAWSGCDGLQWNMNICLSEGDPPMPAELPDAKCGPQMPGTKPPTNGTKLANLNPCPLNACCDVWGQCGITAEFCTDTGTGNPGTAKPDTNGCISNCGTNLVRGDAPATFRRIGYFEGYGFGRECLYQDAIQIDTSQYTHLHFAFGTLTRNDYVVEVGDSLSQFQFESFTKISGPKRILSFGGWDFSALPATYMIFREGVATPESRLKMATNIADFIKKYDLDGVDIDWEYPGAPDIPDIPAADPGEGNSYLEFLVILKNLLPGKSVSIAAPSSFWYLKAYPIDKIAQVVDYIVFMTYDLHGQWDADKPDAIEYCPNGNCLRSQVNLTETMSSLVMITKAGVPSNKVVAGITSYGRSFNMAQAGCYGPECQFTGSQFISDATPGRCTATAGYISNAEIGEIVGDGDRVTKHFVDEQSNTRILVYDNTQWVGYMDDDIRAHRHQLYTGLNLGGTTNWATDLEKFNDPPLNAGSWLDFKLNIESGSDPYIQPGDRHGNWTEINCDSQAAADILHLSPSGRWSQMDCDDAWKDAVAFWKNEVKNKVTLSFSGAVALFLNGPPRTDCGTLDATSNCGQTVQCDGFQNKGSGAAAWEIWNSLVLVHEIYQAYHDALYKAAAGNINPALQDFENKFSPVPPEEDNRWKLLLLDLVTVGAASAAAPFFNNFLSKLPYFINRASAADNIKDLTVMAIGQSTTIAKDLLGTEGNEWTASSQAKFSNYLGQTITGWGNITSLALRNLFDGEDDSIDTLTKIISDGKLISGNGDETHYGAPEGSEAQLEADISKTFFAYAVPMAWTFSKHYAFVVDSGYDCGATDPLDDYIRTDDMHATSGCVDDKLYYLVSAEGDAQTCTNSCTGGPSCDNHCSDNKFKPPPGLGSLDGKNFGGVTVGDLIKGSVRTYKDNGNKNGAKFVDATRGGSFDDLMKNDVTTPGFIRLPVCSPEQAYKNWDDLGPGSDPNYPCQIPKGPDKCQDSSFVDQTSDASPPVSDCEQIIKNIEGDTLATWTTGIATQREILHYGECKFGVESKSGADGNVTFEVGAQDVIDIIREAIKRFGSSGKIGAKGVVDCSGNVHDTTIEWGIY